MDAAKARRADKSPMPPLSLSALPPHVIRRCVYAAITVIAIIATLLLLSARERRLVSASDAGVQAAWQSATPLAGAALTREALLTRFAIKQGSANGDLSWQTASLAELRASLLAFDLAQIRLTQVKVTRSGAGFMVTAERAP